MKIVKFRNGTYGIRKWSLFGYEFKDLSDNGIYNDYWWNLRWSNSYKSSCQSTLQIVKEIYKQLNDNGRVVNFI